MARAKKPTMPDVGDDRMKRPRVTGRPTRLTPKVHEVLVFGASKGLPIESCASLARVGKRTLQRWLATGKDALDSDAKLTRQESLCRDLVLDFMEQSASYDLELHQIMWAARDDGKLRLNCCWQLERRKPHLYGTGNRPTPEEEETKVTAPDERAAAAKRAFQRTRSSGRKA